MTVEEPRSALKAGFLQSLSVPGRLEVDAPENGIVGLPSAGDNGLILTNGLSKGQALIGVRNLKLGSTLSSKSMLLVRTNRTVTTIEHSEARQSKQTHQTHTGLIYANLYPAEIVKVAAFPSVR